MVCAHGAAAKACAQLWLGGAWCWQVATDCGVSKVFAAGHVPGAVNFDLDGPFINYLAWMMPWGTPVTLLGSTPEQVHAAHRELVRVGIVTTVGQAAGGPDVWLDEPGAARRTRPAPTRHLCARRSQAPRVHHHIVTQG